MNPTEEPMFATPDSWDREAAARERGPLRLPGMFVWLALVWLYWFEISRETLAPALGVQASERALVLAAIGGVVGRIAAQLIEAGFYVLLWRALGRTLPFANFFVTIVSLSLLDVASVQLVRWAADSPPAWVAVLCGFQAVPGALVGEPGLRVAFGGFGLLTLARIAGTAWPQRPAGGWRTGLALTGAIWLAGRLATWWTTDLVRGVSPLP
jgi:hypothetical protein